MEENVRWPHKGFIGGFEERVIGARASALKSRGLDIQISAIIRQLTTSLYCNLGNTNVDRPPSDFA